MLVNLGYSVHEEENEDMQCVYHGKSAIEDIEIILQRVECDSVVVLPVEQVSFE